MKYTEEKILCSCTRRVTVVKMSTLPKAIYRFNEIPVQDIYRTRTNNLKIYTELNKRSQITNAILRKKNRTGVIRFPDLRLHYKVTVIKSPRYWNKNRFMKENKEPRNKFMHLWLINLQQRRQEYRTEKRQSLQ